MGKAEVDSRTPSSPKASMCSMDAQESRLSTDLTRRGGGGGGLSRFLLTKIHRRVPREKGTLNFPNLLQELRVPALLRELEPLIILVEYPYPPFVLSASIKIKLKHPPK